jgi:hypothetical protein
VVAGPVGLGPKSDCTGEGLQRLWMADQSSIGGGGTASVCPQLSDSGKSLVVGHRWVFCSGTNWPTDCQS